MRPYQELLSGDGKATASTWARMRSDCRGTQESVLMSILDAASHSEFGRSHGFSGITTIEGFREAVPISEYSDFSGYIDRMAAGETDMLFDGATEYFISTSGTTGKSKLIPESAAGKEAKEAVNKVRNAAMTRAITEAILGSPSAMAMMASKGLDLKGSGVADMAGKFHFYSVTSAMAGRTTEGGIEIGYASGKTFDGSEFSGMLAYPKELMGLQDGEAAMYLTMLFALRYDDVIIVTSNNAARFYARVVHAQENAERIIEDMRNGTIDPGLVLTDEERRMAEGYMVPDPERADQLQAILDSGRENFTPRNYWPNLLAARFWLSGSVGVNVPRVRPLLPEGTVLFDMGYGASEARINIPRAPGSGSGTLATFSAFYEFIPVGGDEVLTADQLEAGGQYELIVTNYSGLYRYRLNDIIVVRGFDGDTPDIEFLTKSREILNIAQEKVPASGVLECVGRMAAELGFGVRQAQVRENLEAQAYDVYIEPEGRTDVPTAEMSERLDGLLRGSYDLYDRNRMFGSLNGPIVTIMRDGWQESMFAEREAQGAPRSQIKLDARAMSVPDERWVLRR